jgi:hypothetical protein
MDRETRLFRANLFAVIVLQRAVLDPLVQSFSA